MADRDELLAALDATRAEFHDALGEVDVELVTVPGVVGDWSVRDLVVHVAAWAEHGAEALDLATSGRGDEFAYDRAQTDAMNARIQRDAGSISPRDALAREAATFDAFRDRIAALDPEALDVRLGNGDTVEAVIRYDGIEHYAEHAAHVRAWFGDDPPEGHHDGDD